MKMRDLEMWAKRFQYKPGATLIITQEAAYDAVALTIRLMAPDATDPACTYGDLKPVMLRRVVAWEAMKRLKEADLKHLVFSMLVEIETHEIEEFLRFDGTYYKHPHPNLLGSNAVNGAGQK